MAKQKKPSPAPKNNAGVAEDVVSPEGAYTVLSAGDDATTWLQEISTAKKRAKEGWHEKGQAAIQRYRDERPSSGVRDSSSERRTNLFWSSTDTIMSHLCGDLGTPDVKRSFPQPGKKTKIARAAAEVLEKTLRVEDHAHDVQQQFESAIEDHLIPGLGQVWLDLDEAEDEDGETTWFEAKIVHVNWADFIHGEGRTWNELPWVGRRLLFSYADLKKAWPEDADEVPLNYMLETADSKKSEQVYKRAEVYEIWVKETKQRIYVADDFKKLLQADDDPYRLKDFFPCPPALYAIKTSGDMTPVSFYHMYEDQISELDKLTTRAWRLVEALKYTGVYGWRGDDTLPDIGRLDDGNFQPFKQFELLAEAGGLEKLFMVRDLAPISIALKGVYDQREIVKQAIFEVTGVADILRGASDPTETAAAQKLKARFGSTRASRRQRIVQRFVRNAYRLKAELIAEHYPREQLQEMTGILLPTKEDQDKARTALEQAKQWMEQAQQGQQNIVRQLMPPQPQAALPTPGMPQGAPGRAGRTDGRSAASASASEPASGSTGYRYRATPFAAPEVRPRQHGGPSGDDRRDRLGGREGHSALEHAPPVHGRHRDGRKRVQ